MERVIVAEMTDYMLENAMITRHQHGFLNRRSTATNILNILECLSDWTLAVDNNETKTVVYIDFARAFDTVSRPKLLTKLQAYGISGNLLQFISSFLTDRSQKTRVGQSLSTAVSLISGIVQGSCLGPLLFLIYINDTAAIFDERVKPKLFADDLKLYMTVKNDADRSMFQANLDKLGQWAKDWQLKISATKCCVLNIGRQSTAPTYYIDGQSLPNVDQSIDLGIIIDGKLKFSKHINTIVRKAITRANLILKCFYSRDTHTLVRAFKVYVRPIVEYCSSAWSPHLVKDIILLESVQRKFTKRLTGMQNIPYLERLRQLNLERLDVRRLRADLILAYKILFGITGETDISQFFTFCDNLHNTRGHQFKLLATRANRDTRNYFFSNRVIRAWNSLPQSTNFSSLRTFRKSLYGSYLENCCVVCY
jgi:hypothetical protein